MNRSTGVLVRNDNAKSRREHEYVAGGGCGALKVEAIRGRRNFYSRRDEAGSMVGRIIEISRWSGFITSIGGR